MPVFFLFCILINIDRIVSQTQIIMAGIVYLICDPESDTYKIGVTKRDVNERLKELQTGNSSELFVVHTYKCNDPYRLEQMLHNRFRTKGALNEWFSLESEDITGFEDICRKTDEIIKSLSDNVFFAK